MGRLGDMALGTNLLVPTSAGYASFIIVYQGVPSSKYYNADGTWVLMTGLYTTSTFYGSVLNYSNNYTSSNVHSLLNSTFYSSISDEAKSAVKLVRIPYWKGRGNEGYLCTGSNGLSCHVFAPSLTECGLSASEVSTIGTVIPYVQSNRTLSSVWYTRTPKYGGNWTVWYIKTDGTADLGASDVKRGVRGMMVLDSSYIYEYGTFSLNSPPVISSGYGTSLGKVTEGFDYDYTITDNDSSYVTVTEYYDNVKQKSFTAAVDTKYTMDNVNSDNWPETLNGDHSFKIVAADTYDTATRTTTFTKKVTTCEITMKTPITVASSYTQLEMHVEGDIPSDADFTVQITENGTANSPTWRDVTSYVVAGETITFSSTSTLSGRSFNFKVTASRGSSDTSGYITRIWGTFVRPQTTE